MTHPDDDPPYDAAFAAFVLDAALRFEPLPLPGVPLAPPPASKPRSAPLAQPPRPRVVRAGLDEPRAPWCRVTSTTKLRRGWALWLECGHVNFSDDTRETKRRKMRCSRCGPAPAPALKPAAKPRPTMEEIADALGRAKPRSTRTFNPERFG